MIPKSMSSTLIGDGHRFSDQIMRDVKVDPIGPPLHGRAVEGAS